MATKVGEVFISMAVDAASGNLSVRQLVSALGDLDVVSAGTVGILGKVTETLARLAQSAVDASAELSDLHETTGADPKIVQQWEKAAQRINIHSGSIIAAIKGVDKMMGAIGANRQGVPGEMGWIGLTPATGKFDKSGHPIMKDFFQLFKEVADPKSRYWGLPDQTKRQLLGGIFPSSSPDDMFRLLNAERAGKLHPERISVLEDKQVADMTKVRENETKLRQTMEGAFDKLLIGGNAFSDVLTALTAKLQWIDNWLGSKEGHQTLNIVGKEIGGFIRNVSLNPLTAFGGLGMGRDMASFIGGEFGIAPVRAPAIPAGPLKLSTLEAKLSVDFNGLGGAPPWRKEIFLRQGVDNANVERVTINAGNGGLGQ